MQRIFQFCIVLHPTKEGQEKGEQSELVVEVTNVMADSERSAVVLAGRAIPEPYLDRLDRLEVAVRPF